MIVEKADVNGIQYLRLKMEATQRAGLSVDQKNE